MKQIIVKRMTLSDYISNLFYRIRFWSYRKIFKGKLKNKSSEIKDNLELTFIDEFDEVSWGNQSDDKWIIGEGWGAYNPRKPINYFGAPELIEGTSLAKFTVKYKPKEFSVPEKHKEELGDKIIIPFEKTKIGTTKFFRQQYGQFECRCTIPYDRGAWAAWWIWGSTWPPEIDIFELFGKKDGKSAGVQEINLHYGKDAENNRSSIKGWPVRIDTIKNKNEFHEFTLKWTDKKVECFTDGVKIFRYTRKDILDKWFNVMPDANMKLILNNGLDMKNVDLDEHDYYSEFLVDYVRVYKKK